MEMIPTIKPYGGVNIKEISAIKMRPNGFFFLDKYGLWKIDEKTFQYLKDLGVKEL